MPGWFRLASVQGNQPVDTRIPSPVDLAHSPGPERRENFVGSKSGARSERHRLFEPFDQKQIRENLAVVVSVGPSVRCDLDLWDDVGPGQIGRYQFLPELPASGR